MERDKFLKLVGNGRFFSVKFVKRTNGELRHMIGRTGVKFALGGESRYKDEDYGLVTVWDIQNKGYRKIPVDSIIEIQANGNFINAANRRTKRILHQRASAGLR